VNSARVNDIAFDVATNVWFAKDIGVAALNINSNVWQNFTRDSTRGRLPSDVVHGVATDLHLTRWFGTDSGLVRLADTAWTTFNTSNSPLPSNQVTAVRYDQRGNLWIGTANGVAAYKHGGTTF
jgi:ligand-binding sensor domain-containing protein